MSHLQDISVASGLRTSLVVLSRDFTIHRGLSADYAVIYGKKTIV